MNLLLSIVQSDWFLIIVIIWGIIALADRSGRESLLVHFGINKCLVKRPELCLDKST